MSRSTARTRKAQFSAEFMILFIIFMIAISTALAVSINRTQTVSRAQVDVTAGRILDEAAGRVNTAFLEGDGFSMKVSLPEKILGKDYTLEVESNEAILRLGGKTYVSYLLTSNVTGDFVKGTNLVRNSHGRIIIKEEA